MIIKSFFSLKKISFFKFYSIGFLKKNDIFEKEYKNILSNFDNFIHKYDINLKLKENSNLKINHIFYMYSLLNNILKDKSQKPKEKIQFIETLQLQIINYLKKINKIEITHNFKEFLFSLNPNHEKEIREYLDNLFPFHLKFEQNENNDKFLIKLLQIFSKFKLNNDFLLQLISKRLILLINNDGSIINSQLTNKDICHTILIMSKNLYVNKDLWDKISVYILNNIKNFDSNCISMILYSTTINSNNIQLDILKKISENFNFHDFTSINIDFTIRTLVNILLLDNQDLKLIVSLLNIIKLNFKKIDSLTTISMLGWIIEKINKKAFEIDKNLLIDLCEQYYNFLFFYLNNKEFNCLNVSIKKKTIPYLLKGLYTIKFYLNHNIKLGQLINIYQNIEKIIFAQNLIENSDFNEFITILYYFAKEEKGSDIFWNKIESKFIDNINIFELEHFSYLSTGFKYKINFNENLWIIIGDKIIEILEKENKNANFSNLLKNVIYLCSSQKFNDEFWKKIINYVKNNKFLIEKQCLLKIINYIGSVKCIENKEFLILFDEYFYNDELIIIDYCQTLISLIDLGKLNDFSIKLSEIKSKILIKIEKYLTDQKINYEILDQNQGIKLLWIIKKLDIFSINESEINNYIIKFKDKLINLDENLLIKLIWATLQIQSLKTNQNLEIIQEIIIKKMFKLEQNHISMIILGYGINSVGNINLWENLLNIAYYYIDKFNSQQFVNILSGIAKNHNFTLYNHKFFNLIFDKIQELKDSLSEIDKKELKTALSIISKYNLKLKILKEIIA